jgi:hypothetical protein
LVNLEREFRASYKELSELQRAAEKTRGLQETVWEKIQTLPMIRDILAVESAAEQTKFAQCFLGPYRDALSLMQRDLARRQGIL